MAFGTGTINSAAGAVSDLFAAEGLRLKAKGLRLEAQNYDAASEFAEKNARFAEVSTGIKTAQTEREIYKTIGGQQADIAGAGFAQGGSALDLLRDSASQGALQLAVGQQQGLIQEEGYEVQAKNYQNMASAARFAAEAEENAATGATWTAGIKAAGAVFSIFGGGGSSSGPTTLGGPSGPTPFF